MVQLPSYLERVLAGGRDLALVLLPLLNDLRAVRGNALLSEGTLLLLNLKSDKQAQPQRVHEGEQPMTVEQWARRLRARYQVGLIGWIRGERMEQNLDILAAVARKLEQIATRQPVFQLWWVVGAVIEALQENGIESGQSVKRLLGLGDREIRRLYEQGEARYAQAPPVELLNNLLYYVGRSESTGGRVSAVRASFRLTELLPVDESIEQERENLSAPSVKLMQTVAAAIREDLGKVKDVLDIFVRRGAGQPQELASQVEMLRKIGDTLGVLGLGELRAGVQAETERLGKIVAGQLKADETTLVEIAATLIGVEDKLDDQLVGLILPQGRRRAAAGRRGQRVPAGAVGGAARVHREHGAHQGGHHPVGGRHARCVRPRQLAGPDARHRGRPAAARQGARGRHHRGHHAAAEARHAAGRARAAAGLRRPPRRCDREHRVLHGDAAGRALRSLVHARQRAVVRAGARAAADPDPAQRAAARPLGLRAHRADPGAGAAGRAPDVAAVEAAAPTLRRLGAEAPPRRCTPTRS